MLIKLSSARAPYSQEYECPHGIEYLYVKVSVLNNDDEESV